MLLAFTVATVCQLLPGDFVHFPWRQPLNATQPIVKVQHGLISQDYGNDTIVLQEGPNGTGTRSSFTTQGLANTSRFWATISRHWKS